MEAKKRVKLKIQSDVPVSADEPNKWTSVRVSRLTPSAPKPEEVDPIRLLDPDRWSTLERALRDLLGDPTKWAALATLSVEYMQATKGKRHRPGAAMLRRLSAVAEALPRTSEFQTFHEIYNAYVASKD